MWHTFHQPTNQPFPYQQCFCHSPPSLFSLQALEGRGEGERQKQAKAFLPPPFPPSDPIPLHKVMRPPRQKVWEEGKDIPACQKRPDVEDEGRATGFRRKKGGEDYVRTVMACA